MKHTNKVATEETLSEHFTELGRVNVRDHLSHSLKDLYKEVEENCAGFRENLFKDLNDLEESMVYISLIHSLEDI
jgi:hypothetical protein